MGFRLNRLAETVLTSTHSLCFEQKYEKYQSFLYENVQVMEIKFSIYLNRCLFVINRRLAHMSDSTSFSRCGLLGRCCL